jgi:hypothetical protein
MRFLTRLSTALLAGQFIASTPLLANDSFTCWAVSHGNLQAATLDYWTQERRQKAVAVETNGAIGRTSLDTDLRGIVGDAERAPIGEAPYKYGGKLFYTRGGTDYVASAQFAAADNIVIGAAHSLWMDNKAASNILFSQGYDNRAGVDYLVDVAAVLTDWTRVSVNPPSLQVDQYDYSVMRTMKPSTVGRYELGEAGVDTKVTITGYPSRLEGGNYMYRETATIRVKAGAAYDARPHPMYGGGASGGGWFVGTEEPYTLVSVVAAGEPAAVDGPAFTQDTKDMVAYVRNGCK